MADNDMDRVVPLGQLDDFKVADGEPDVRGWEVMASDGRKIGEVDELLVDTAAMKVRYLDVDVDGAVMGDGHDRHVLIPIGYARLERERDCVLVDGLATADLVGMPAYTQGPLTRDFETSVRDSFSRRGTSSAGMAGAGSGMMDTAGLDNTPGTGTGMGMSGGGVPLTDTGLRTDTHHFGDEVPDGAGMRNAGYDLDRGTTSPLQAGGSDLRDTGSPRTGMDSDLEIRESGGISSSGLSNGGIGGGGGDRLSTGMSAGSSGGHTLGSGAAPMSAGSQGPAGGMGTDREPQGDMSHRAGMAGSDYLHNADEDFYASDAFDEGRFYGRSPGPLSGEMGDAGTLGGGSGSLAGSSERTGGESGGGMTAGTRGEPGHHTGGVGASRQETDRLAEDARELLREDHRNRDVGGSGSL